jgi:hypothetical protein
METEMGGEKCKIRHFRTQSLRGTTLDGITFVKNHVYEPRMSLFQAMKKEKIKIEKIEGK